MDSSFSLSPYALIGTIMAFTVFLYRFSSQSGARINSCSRDGEKTPPTAPEAGGAWPLVGHLHLLGGPLPPHLILGRMADEYGPLFTIKLGIYRALIVNSWEVAKECLTVNDRVFATRPKSVSSEVMAYNYAMFGLSPYGQYWRHARKISVLGLLSNRRIELLEHVRQSEVRTSVNLIYKQWEEHAGESPKVLVDMKRWFGDINLNVVFRMIARKRFEGQEDEKGRQALRDWLDLAGRFIVSDGLPFLRWLDLGGHERRMKETARELDRVVQGWLEEHKSKRQSMAKDDVKDDGKNQDFMDVMLSIAESGEESSEYDADTVIKATCMALIIAATDTTTVTLTWALSLLLNHPKALKKAQQELDDHIGRERRVQESDIKNLMYIQAIVKETLRLYPAAPLALPHEAMTDCIVNGYHIPKGTRLFLNLQKIQRDACIWPNPCEFHPERFLTTHKEFDVRGQNFELIPFGSGRRICAGINLALQMIMLSLASLLHAFDFTTPSNELVDMTEAVGLTNLKASPLEVLATPRLPKFIYK